MGEVLSGSITSGSLVTGPLTSGPFVTRPLSKNAIVAWGSRTVSGWSIRQCYLDEEATYQVEDYWQS